MDLVDLQRTAGSGSGGNAVDRPGSDEQPSALTAPQTLKVVAWADPVIDAHGVDPRSWYAEHFWLPVVGPTCLWFLRRSAARLERADSGFAVEMEEAARCLGLGTRLGRNSPFGRALARCVTFELARWQGHETIAVRRRLPPLPRRHLIHLPQGLQEAHRRWSLATGSRPSSLDEHRLRARQLALGLVALGDPFDGAEQQLLRWGVHPSLAHEALSWARGLQMTAEAALQAGPAAASASQENHAEPAGATGRAS